MENDIEMKHKESRWQQVSAMMTERQNNMGSVESTVEKMLDSVADLLQEAIKHRR